MTQLYSLDSLISTQIFGIIMNICSRSINGHAYNSSNDLVLIPTFNIAVLRYLDVKLS